MKPKPKLVAKSFKATLERIPSSLGSVIIRIPFDVSKVWGTRAKVRVKGEINGFAFRAPVFPTSKGYHCMLVNKRLRTGANAALGETAYFRLEPDTAKLVATVPPELQRILNEDRSFRRWFDQLSFSIRSWLCYWIVNVKNPETRLRRAEQVAEQLLATMEAEVDLPPILKLAFARDPRAYQGWQSMTPLQRRYQLFGIFYCRTPETRDRRISKMLEDALARAEGKPRSKASPEEDAHEELE
ncbi:MAG TPA: YdeI/OmpD-associated family protein [Candidatus Cybelea sp.]|nr:YdeI/OmpD-associated family protein [Candidatus Cybelea sp.]